MDVLMYLLPQAGQSDLVNLKQNRHKGNQPALNNLSIEKIKYLNIDEWNEKYSINMEFANGKTVFCRLLLL